MKPTSEIVYAPKCAGCDILKQKSNNWWTVSIVESLLMIGPMSHVDGYREGVWYLCGHECVHAIVGEYMSENQHPQIQHSQIQHQFEGVIRRNGS